jgi:hypothetical protein
MRILGRSANPLRGDAVRADIRSKDVPVCYQPVKASLRYLEVKVAPKQVPPVRRVIRPGAPPGAISSAG